MSAHPVVFEDCFGWFHPAAGARGAVLCGPHGYEELCTHRVWRGLAQRLADAGLPTVRFDYAGTGDSAGDDTQPGRVRAWLDSIIAAAKWLRAEAGVREVVLVGLRLGATLAGVAAHELGDVEGLALLAPSVTGKAYAREQKALTMMAPPMPGAPPPRPEWKDDLESAGFVLTASTVADLAKLDLLKLQRAPAKRVLLLHRPDAPTDPRLPGKLRELGAAVEEGQLEGYDDLMRDAHFAKVPEHAFAEVVKWAAQGAPGG